MRSPGTDVDDTVGDDGSGDEIEMVLGAFGPQVLLVACAYALGRWVLGLHDWVAILAGLVPAYALAKLLGIAFSHVAHRHWRARDIRPARS